LRVGVLDPDNPVASFDEAGRHARHVIVDLLGPDWSFAGKRVLDFGCGAGKLLRHLLGEARTATFYGCDIDEPSIDWLRAHMSPPINAFVNAPSPPLPLEEASLDLVLAMSVFTHLTTEWSAWLVELHRVLKPDGLLIASFLGRGMSESVAGEPWEGDRIGMNVLGVGTAWDYGGPNVLLSPWWIRAHWGRAFKVLELVDNDRGHGLLLLGKRDRPVTPSELEAPEPDEPRELLALTHQVRQLQRELGATRESGARAAARPSVKAKIRRLRSTARRRLGRRGRVRSASLDR
jgi:SAM-dependent methyltransferase